MGHVLGRGDRRGAVASAVGWAVAVAMVWALPTRADEAVERPIRPDPIDKLVRRALSRAGLDGGGNTSERALHSVLWPSLRLGAAVLRGDRAPTSLSLQWEVSAGLGWRLDRIAADEPGIYRMTAARREALAERVASLWRSRMRLGEESGDVSEDALLRLRGEELDGEIEALTGEPPECERNEACP